jgi:hypothetical protein
MHYARLLPCMSPRLRADGGVVNMGCSASIHR